MFCCSCKASAANRLVNFLETVKNKTLTQAGETRTEQNSSDIPESGPEKASRARKAHSLCREFLLMGFAETPPAKGGFGSAAICTYDNWSVTGTTPATASPAAPARGCSVPTLGAEGDAPGGFWGAPTGLCPGLRNQEPTADSSEGTATPAQSCDPTSAPGLCRDEELENPPGEAEGTGIPLRPGTAPG